MTNIVSLFAGIGGFDLAAEQAGMNVAAHVERDAACRQLLGDKFPDALTLDDVLAIPAIQRRLRLNQTIKNRDEWTKRIDAISRCQILCGGFPCQDVSVAGLRAGLAGQRSGMWYSFRRIIALFRPQWVIIENVPGLLSSNGGRDFGVIVSGLEKLGYGVAWRVLDAQYFDLAQRRERVFVVASLGDQRSAEILFERESVCGNPPPSREAGQGVAGTITQSARRGDGNGREGLRVSGPIGSNAKGGQRTTDLDHGTFVDQSDIAGAVSCKWAKGADGPAGDECYNLTLAFKPSHYTRDKDGAPNSIAPPLSADADKGDQEPVIFQTIAYRTAGNCGPFEQGDKTGALNTATDPSQNIVANQQAVRRLTPLECERLQGFPDGWTAGFSDSARYKMLGNAVAVPCVKWILVRIARAIAKPFANEGALCQDRAT